MIGAGARTFLLGLSVATTAVVIAAGIETAMSPAIPVSSFPELPKEVASDLRSRGCSIAREYVIKNHVNVLRDDFTGESREDWAVLCVSGGQAQVIAYRNGGLATMLSAAPFSVPKSYEDASSIRVVDGAYVAAHNRSSPISRQMGNRRCIEDIVGSGSAIYCFVEGNWQKYAGAD